MMRHIVFIVCLVIALSCVVESFSTTPQASRLAISKLKERREWISAFNQQYHSQSYSILPNSYQFIVSNGSSNSSSSDSTSSSSHNSTSSDHHSSDNGSSGSSDTISPQCESDLYMLSKFKYPDSIQMIDYSGKGMNDMGNIDLCLALPSNVSEYCVVDVDLGGFYNVFMGLCLPASCSDNDVLLALETIASMLGGNTNSSSFINGLIEGGEISTHCYSYDHQSIDVPWTNGAGIVLGVVAFIACLVIGGTTIEALIYTKVALGKRSSESYSLINNLLPNSINHDNDNDGSQVYVDYQKQVQNQTSLLVKILLAFSLIQNYQSFVNNKSDKKYFDVLDGIRFVSTCWVVMGHTILFSFLLFDNAETLYYTLRKSFIFQLVAGGEFAVDTFFMLSGFLVAYTLIQQLEKLNNGESAFSSYAANQPDFGTQVRFWIKYIVHRYIRLTPLYAFLIFVFWKLSFHFGGGPLWYMYPSVLIGCDQYWWTNLLYINTLYPSTMANECFAHGWYLGDDMIYYILLAPLAVLLYRKQAKYGFAFVALAIAITITTNLWITLKYHLYTFFEFQQAPTNDFTTDIYQKPWTRCGAYAIGLAVAMIYDNKATMRAIKTKIAIRILYYLLALGVTFSLVFIFPYNYFNSSDGWTNNANAFFNAFAHTGFVYGLGLFLLTCFSGHGGFVAWVFERPIFKYFSKLTYSTYLIHPMVIYVTLYSRTTLYHYDKMNVAAMVVSTLTFSFAAAFVVHLCVEKPCANLERIIFGDRAKKSTN